MQENNRFLVGTLQEPKRVNLKLKPLINPGFMLSLDPP